MIDLHTHSLFSDGELLPAELVRRADVAGYQALAITDHADTSNLDWIIPRIIQVCRDLNTYWPVRAIPGIELTHLPPALIPSMISRARNLGAQVVLVHGETVAEPVPPGTNRQAIAGGVDILAHPGLIAEEEVVLAREKGVFLEITSRQGHSLTNGHVARLAQKNGAPMVLNTDTHQVEDLLSKEKAWKVVLGAGLLAEDFEQILKNSAALVSRLGEKT
jgi:histidinol phosphatase-like PHP family hydrolase